MVRTAVLQNLAADAWQVEIRNTIKCHEYENVMFVIFESTISLFSSCTYFPKARMSSIKMKAFSQGNAQNTANKTAQWVQKVHFTFYYVLQPSISKSYRTYSPLEKGNCALTLLLSQRRPAVGLRSRDIRIARTIAAIFVAFIICCTPVSVLHYLDKTVTSFICRVKGLCTNRRKETALVSSSLYLYFC